MLLPTQTTCTTFACISNKINIVLRLVSMCAIFCTILLWPTLYPGSAYANQQRSDSIDNPESNSECITLKLQGLLDQWAGKGNVLSGQPTTLRFSSINAGWDWKYNCGGKGATPLTPPQLDEHSQSSWIIQAQLVDGSIVVASSFKYVPWSRSNTLQPQLADTGIVYFSTGTLEGTESHEPACAQGSIISRLQLRLAIAGTFTDTKSDGTTQTVRTQGYTDILNNMATSSHKSPCGCPQPIQVNMKTGFVLRNY